MIATKAGQRIRAARLAMHPHVTQREVAKRLKLSPSAVNLWEKNKTMPRGDELVELARWFGVSTDWLLGLDMNVTAPRKRGAPPCWTVPVVSASDLMKWHWDAVSEVLQTVVAYPPSTAAAVLVASSALTSACPAGAYAVVSKSHPADPGSVVLAAVGRSEPVVRRLVSEGRDQLLIGDDARWPTVRLEDGVRIIGRVTEVTLRKMM